MPAEKVTISIIIPTRNQVENLREALISLGKLDYPRELFEVIIIDDHSTPDTAELVESLQYQLDYSHIYEKLKDKTGISAARNRGINIAKGDLLIFTDDDCLFEPGWLQHYDRNYRKGEYGALGGPDRTPPGSDLFTTCVGALFTSFIGTGGLRRGDKTRLGYYFPKGCNIAVPARVFEEVGFFDENLQPAEEIELGNRIKKAGFKIKFIPEAFVWHKRKSNLTGYLKKIFRIGYIRQVLSSRRMETFQIGHYVPFTGLFLLFVLGLLSLFFPIFLSIISVILSLYLLVVIISALTAGFKTGKTGVFFILCLLTPLHHLTHALGVTAGLWDRLFSPGKLYPYFDPEYDNEK